MIGELCPTCKEDHLRWDNDEDAESIEWSIAGTVSYYHCENCGTEIEVFVPIIESEDKK